MVLFSLYVVSCISHAAFLMQLQMFLTGFTSGDCEGNIVSIIVLNHAYIAMALWQRALSCCEGNKILSKNISIKISFYLWILGRSSSPFFWDEFHQVKMNMIENYCRA